MSLPGELQSQKSEDKQKRTSESFERYDLTGQRIRRWSVSARDKFLGTLRRLCNFGIKVGETELPGTREPLEQKAKKLPGKTVELIEQTIDKTGIENKLKSQQAQTEFFKQELLRQQTEKTRAETRGQQLDNVAREIEIREKIRELTEGKTDIHVISEGDKRLVIVGNLLPSETAGDGYTASPESVSNLDLPQRIETSLTEAGIVTVQQLVNKRKSELLAINGIGKKSVQEVEKSLLNHGLALCG